ncbi:MAG: iron-containing alcohol dehydrogenase [Candidatus Aureabacteria bacterium]|nr:iron-containing alcohol dehydrogenase [Candidatus Auribacterota bacterium]
MNFEFATASSIIFGAGTLKEVAPLAAEMGTRALVVTGRSTARAHALLDQLRAHKLHTIGLAVSGEPTTSLVTEGLQRARDAGCNIAIAIGGGSVIDTGKAIAALLTNGGELFDYLEVIGRGKRLSCASAPFIAIPTTSGTGAEVTRNAVLFSPEQHVKVSMRSPLMLPRLAVVDPVLSHSLPPAVTASTGLDALTQLIEPYVSAYANPLTDGICREGIRFVARSLRIAYEDGGNAAAREDMSLASLFGGLALANAGLGAAHGFAGPLGGMFSAPHGAICARLLPWVMEANVRALERRAPSSPTLSKYDEIARLLTGSASARAREGISWVSEICSSLQIPSLAVFGLGENDIAPVVARSRKASSMKSNPIVLTDEELAWILTNAGNL